MILDVDFLLEMFGDNMSSIVSSHIDLGEMNLTFVHLMITSLGSIWKYFLPLCWMKLSVNIQK